MIEVIIMMVGFGCCFLDVGYIVLKYRIEVYGKFLFVWFMFSLCSFIEVGVYFIFVVCGVDNSVNFIYVEVEKVGIVCILIVEFDVLIDG